MVLLKIALENELSKNHFFTNNLQRKFYYNYNILNSKEPCLVLTNHKYFSCMMIIYK